ncbi:hypothetical protein V502_05059 [Pseudogymnoascus sp. VKM F-4520 (FW-2644)]|nr:hypothetical protein V502_05059 [Pseudogymnoascus sp. VKM F-4520 (FW-2644)]
MPSTLDSGDLKSSEIIDPPSTTAASIRDLEKSSYISASLNTPPSIQAASDDVDTTASLQARSRVDLSVLPLLFLGLFVFQLDRMNLASALTAGLKNDIKITQADVNLGNQMMFLGIVVLEIPSNMLLQRIGPRIYISIQVIIFGLIATLQIFVRDRTGFLIIRSFLGLAEAGYIPGAIYTLSTWYRHKELATRVAIFFFGMFGGNAKESPARLWHFEARSTVEGIFTIAVGLLIGFLLPGSPERPRPLFFEGLVRISESDGALLQQRIAADSPNKSYEPQHIHITPAKVWKTLSHWRRWPHLISTSLVFSTWSSLTTYTPTIMMSLGFDRTAANALACIGPVIALTIVFLFARLTDVGKWSRWGLWTAVNAFAVGYHPVQNTWLQLNCHDPAERSISIALWVMSAISGLMYGTQFFQEKDLPLYSRGLEIMIGVSVAGLVLAGVQILIYTAYNRKTKELKERGLIVEGERMEDEFQQLVLQASDNTISVVSPQVQDQDIAGKNKNYLLHRIPFEIRRQILILAFGEQTVHMDLKFRYPLKLADKKLDYRCLHARIEYYSIGTPTYQSLVATAGERQEWRWFSCVCHRFPPNATQLPLGRRRLSPWASLTDPHTDRCLDGSGTCEEWPGEWPVKCQIGIMGWLLSCKQAYLEGVDILYKTNTIHIASPILMQSIQDVISWQRLQDITSLELVWKSEILPLQLGFTGSNNSRPRPPAMPIFPCLRILRISFQKLVYDEEDYSLGIVYPYEDKKILSHRLHDHLLPAIDELLQRIVPPTTDVTVTCSKWAWYLEIDLFLMEKQGKEETRMQRADIEGLKCWRNTPRRIERVSDRALEDAQGVEGRRTGFWIHVCIDEVHLDLDDDEEGYDQNRHDLHNLGPEQYRYRTEPVREYNDDWARCLINE